MDSSQTQPIRLHPDNPHYFLYRDKPTVVVASSEHFGAVLNLDFDHVRYLDTVAACGLNGTRAFLGDYVEPPGAFCIETNTLGPVGERFICPWGRSVSPGYALGGNRFDLDTWNPEYFRRLHCFMRGAQRRGIIVELMLFFAGPCWEYSPLHPDNNVNHTPRIDKSKYHTLDNGILLERQEVYCRKIVGELNGYDNCIYNVAMEPWFNNQARRGFSSQPSDETKDWIERVTQWIADEESALARRHLISVDLCNEGTLIEESDLATRFRRISVFNHHYDTDAASLRINHHRIDRAFAFNETGFMEPMSPQYRMQGWKYLFCGGALYDNLDFTFQSGHEDGSGSTGFSGPWYSGCVNPAVKHQLGALLRFMNTLDFVRMRPDRSVLALTFGDEYSTVLGDCAFAAAGLTKAQAVEKGYDVIVGEAESVNRHPGCMPGAEMLKVKLLFEAGSQVLIGGQVTGARSGGELINTISACIHQRMAADDIATFQTGTHPALTASPIAYQLVNAAEMAICSMKTR